MPIGIIDPLEKVDITDRNRQRLLSVFPALLDHLLQITSAGTSVQKSRQRIRRDHILQRTTDGCCITSHSTDLILPAQNGNRHFSGEITVCQMPKVVHDRFQCLYQLLAGSNTAQKCRDRHKHTDCHRIDHIISDECHNTCTCFTRKRHSHN